MGMNKAKGNVTPGGQFLKQGCWKREQMIRRDHGTK